MARDIKKSLDIEYIPEGETREYTAERDDKVRSYYTQKKQYDKKGNLEKEIWEREDNLGNFITLDDAAYISKEKFKQFTTQKFTPADIIKLAKREGYTKNDGLIIFLYKGKSFCSSEVIRIEPPFGEEYKELTES